MINYNRGEKGVSLSAHTSLCQAIASTVSHVRLSSSGTFYEVSKF